MNILIVDDQATNLKLLRAQLLADGHTVLLAADGVEALAQLESQPVDGVISDILMPNMDGYRLCMEVRKSERFGHLPFVLYTATYESSSDRQLALGVGADAYIIKPASVPELVEALRSAARRAPAAAGLPYSDTPGVLRQYSEVLVQKLEEKNLELRRIEAGLRRAQAMARLAHVVTGLDGAFVSWSDTLPQLTGLPEQALPRDTREWLQLVHPEDRERFRSCSIEAALSRQYRAIEYRLQQPDGKLLHVWHSMDPLEREPEIRQGQAAWFNTLQDISEHKLTELKIRRLSRVYAVLSDIGALIVRERARDDLFRNACRIAVETGGLKMACIGLLDPQTLDGHVVASFGAAADHAEAARFTARADRPYSNWPPSQALITRQAVICNDIAADISLDAGLRVQFLGQGYRSAGFFPLTVGARPVALLALFSGESGAFDAEEQALLLQLAGDLSFAIDHFDKQSQLEHLAYYDPLTGLANRSLFHNRLAQSLLASNGEPPKLATMLLDIERFQRVNDTLGRASGDELLRQVGERLLRANASAARIGANSFALTLGGTDKASEIRRVLDVLLAACFGIPFVLGSTELPISCRVGLALYPADGADADTLMRNAEAALRRSRTSADRVAFYAPEMNAQVAESLAIEGRLRRAIEGREFVLHYQPKVALPGGGLVGAEALIRWHDPARGMVPPIKFIPILEETGMIIEVGRWVVEQALNDLQAWSARGLAVTRLAVNVSPIQLQDRQFVGRLVDAIQQGGDHPEWLELEITESLLMDDVDDSMRKLSILRGMGVTVAIDDFGTGYSSLSYLSRLPIDSLKIDRSFVSAMLSSREAMSIISTIITLAHGLKLQVVAEGVELAEESKVLAQMQCDEAQGFLFSKPLPGEDFASRYLTPRPGA